MHHARVIDRDSAGGGLERIVFDVDDTLAATHRAHGQYIQVEHGGAKAYFALASDPGSNRWTLLLRAVGATATALVGASKGDAVSISAAAGNGFPHAEAVGRPLLLAATGTGIAAVLSSARARLKEGEAARTFFVFGVDDADTVALEDDLVELRTRGISLALAVAKGSPRADHHAVGYVQDVVRGRAFALAGGLVFAAGNAVMIDALRATVPSLGVPARDVRLNWGDG